MISVAPIIRTLVHGRARGEPTAALAAAFHDALAVRLCASAELFARRLGLRSVVITGGCFQNRRRLDGVRSRLEGANLEVLAPRRLPPNDGALAAGQAVVAVAQNART